MNKAIFIFLFVCFVVEQEAQIDNFKYKLTQSTSSSVKIELYNSLGELIKILDEGIKHIGNYEFTFNATGLSSGVYFYRLKKDETQIIKKMIYLK